MQHKKKCIFYILEYTVEIRFLTNKIENTFYTPYIDPTPHKI